MQMPSFKLARTMAKLRLISHSQHIISVLKIKEFKGFREAFTWLHKTRTAQASHSGLPFHLSERNAQTGTELKDRCLWRYRPQLSFALEFSVLSMKVVSVTRCLKWSEMNSTCSFFWDCQPFNCIETYRRGCQSVVHSLPTPRTQFACGLFSETVNQHGRLPLCDSAACGSCARPVPQSGILNFCSSNPGLHLLTTQDLGVWFVGSESSATVETYWRSQYYREESYTNTKRGQGNWCRQRLQTVLAERKKQPDLGKPCCRWQDKHKPPS